MKIVSILANTSLGLMLVEIVPTDLKAFAGIAGSFCGALIFEIIYSYWKKNKKNGSSN